MVKSIKLILCLSIMVMFGCSHSIPPYPPTLLSIEPYRTRTVIEQPPNVITLRIAGVRRSTEGLYVDLSVCGSQAFSRARLLADTAQRMHEQHDLVEVVDKLGNPILMIRPEVDSRDYIQGRNPFFASAPHIAPGAMAAQTYEIAGTDCVIQTWVVRFAENKSARDYIVTLRPGWSRLPEEQRIRREWSALGADVRIDVDETRFVTSRD